MNAIQRDAHRRVGVRVVVAPTVEPLYLADAQDHLREDCDERWIESSISVAREWCENYIGRSISPRTLELTTNEFPCGGLILPFGPVTSVLSVSYTDGDGADQSYTGYQSDDGMLLPAFGGYWPVARCSINSVRVRYRAGYGSSVDSPPEPPLPVSIVHAMKLYLGHLNENRESTSAVKLEQVPMGIYSLLEPYRLRMSMA